MTDSAFFVLLFDFIEDFDLIEVEGGWRGSERRVLQCVKKGLGDGIRARCDCLVHLGLCPCYGVPGFL